MNNPTITIPGHFDYPEFYQKIADALPFCAKVVEVGVFNGASAYFFLDYCKKINKGPQFHLVDHFKYTSIYETLVYLKDFLPAIIIHPKDSVIAACTFADDSLDFVWLDGDHSFDGVTNDLFSFYPKMKSGGVIAGHDLNHSKYQVREAVESYFGKGKFEQFSKSIWFKVKP